MAKKTTIKKQGQPEQPNQGQPNPEQVEQSNGNGPVGATQTTGEPIGTSTTDPDPTDGNPQTEPTPPTKSGSMAIPKRNSKQDVKAKDPETVNVPEPNAGNPHSDDAVDRQMNVEQAVAYVMTTNNPMGAARQLANQRKLVNVTGTFKKLEELGHK